MFELSGKHQSGSVEATFRLASELVKSLQGGEVIAFFGELGSGKTTFIQGMAAGLSITERVISPTFVFIRRYPIQPQAGRRALNWFYHLDLFRASGTEIADELGLNDLWRRPETIMAIEWADRLQKQLPWPRLEIRCQVLGENTREYEIYPSYLSLQP